MSDKSVKQTTLDYLNEPHLSNEDILAIQTKVFGSNQDKRQWWNIFTFIPKPALAAILLTVLAIPTLIFTSQNLVSVSIGADAKNFTSNVYNQAQSNIVYLEIYSDNVNSTASSQTWYDSTTGISKSIDQNSYYPNYSYYNRNQNQTTLETNAVPAFVTAQDSKAVGIGAGSQIPNMNELSTFMRALGQAVTSSDYILDTKYKGEPAYKVMLNNDDGSGYTSIYFIKGTNIVYIENSLYTKKIIYRFINPNPTVQNSIFNNK